MPRPHDSGLQSALANRLREVRTRAGWSQERLAATIGVAPNNISHYEKGKKALTVGTLSAIAEALGVRFADLVNVDAAPPLGRPPASGAEEIAQIYASLGDADQQLLLGVARLMGARGQAPDR